VYFIVDALYFVDTTIKCTFYLFLFFINFLRLRQTKLPLLLLTQDCIEPLQNPNRIESFRFGPASCSSIGDRWRFTALPTTPGEAGRPEDLPAARRLGFPAPSPGAAAPSEVVAPSEAELADAQLAAKIHRILSPLLVQPRMLVQVKELHFGRD
jgi:hypothetical protein